MTPSLVAADGTPLASYAWGAPGGRGTVVLVHGLGEHLGRHRLLAERLAAAGWLVVGADLRGHGLSGGPRGHVARFGDYLDDLTLVVAAARAQGGGRPIVLVGHSLGALVALRLVETRRMRDLLGLALSGVGLEPLLAVPWWKLALGRVGAWLCPRLPVSSDIPAWMLSRDPAVCEAYADDLLAHRVVTPAWFREFEEARRAAMREAGSVAIPVLLLHGEADPLVSVEGSRRLAAALTAAPSTLRVYPGARHEVFTDPQCQEALSDLEAWMSGLESDAVRRAS